MSPDRYGEPERRSCRNPSCRRGWLGEDEQGHPIPCLDCKDHLIKGHSAVNDFAEREPSARARAAIEMDERK